MDDLRVYRDWEDAENRSGGRGLDAKSLSADRTPKEVEEEYGERVTHMRKHEPDVSDNQKDWIIAFNERHRISF